MEPLITGEHRTLADARLQSYRVAFLDAPLVDLIMPTFVVGCAGRNCGYAKRTHEKILALQERSDAADA